MTRPLMHIASQIFGQPLAITENAAIQLVAALRSELNIDLIETVEGQRLGQIEMERISSSALSFEGGEDARPARKAFQQIGNIAYIPVEGVLTKKWGLDPWCGMCGYDGIKAKVIASMDDSSVAGILFDYHTPGGTVSSMLETAELIYSCSERNGGKPIWAMANDMAASAGMLLFSGADKTFVTQTGMIGSMGVVTIHIDRQEEAKMRGQKVTIIRSGAHKYEGNAYEDLSPDALGRIQAQIDMIRELYIESAGRNLASDSTQIESMKKIVRETEGLTYIGAQARDMGLVSAVASEDQVWAEFMDRLSR